MGLDRSKRTRLLARCCHGAFFGIGFVFTVLTIAVMFWIAWCYFGLTVVQVSDTQRRALVNYSYTTSKPLSTPTTAAPSRSTTIATEETSVNTISKFPTTDSVLRGSSRGESQLKIDRKKEAAVISSLAKGDFAARDRATYSSSAATPFPPKDASDSVISTPRGPPKNKDESHSSSSVTAAILTRPDAEDPDDRIYARRVLPPGAENRPEEKSESNDRAIRRNPSSPESVSRSDILPTKVYSSDAASGSSRVQEQAERPIREEDRPQRRDYIDRDKPELPRRDDIQSSRRSDPESVYREPNFDSEYPRRYSAGSDRGRPAYDEIDDDRGSRGKYDKRDRGRESDDRYSKGDTRVYPDERGVAVNPPTSEDRYRVRERYPDEAPRRGDDDRYDDRYRDYDEDRRNRDRDTRYRDRDVDRSPVRDDRYRDDERYRPRDEDRYRDRVRDDDGYRRRDDERYRPRDDDSYRSRDDDRYRSRDDDRYRTRDDDRYRPRDDDRYRPRDDRYRDDDRYPVREGDRNKPREEDRYRSDPEDRRDKLPRSRTDEERYRPRIDETKSESSASRLRDVDTREPVSRGSSVLPAGDRKPINSRPEHDVRVEESTSDYDIPPRNRQRPIVRDDVSPSRVSRPGYDEERYRDRDRDDDYRRLSRYGDEVRISPTRARDDSSFSRSSLVDSRPKDMDDDSRYTENSRDRVRDDRYDKDDRSIRLQDSRSSVPLGESSRRLIDDSDRYRTRLPNEKVRDPKLNDRREEVVLDRRSYASDEDSEYRKGSSRTVNTYEDRTRIPYEDTRRRYSDEERYSRRDPVDEEDYRKSRPREVYDRDSSKSRDRYDDEYRRYDDKYTPRDDDRYSSSGERLPPLPVRRYDTYPENDERSRRRDPEISISRTDDSRDRGEKLIPISSSRSEERLYSRDDFVDPKPSRRHYDDDTSLPNNRDFRNRDSDDRRYSSGSRAPANSKEPALGSSMSPDRPRDPTDVVIREKRFQSTDNRYQSSRVYDDDISSDRGYVDIEPKSRESVRPLSAKDVIEAAIRHSDTSDQNSRKVYYPVFDPRVSNLTSPEIIRPSERRGTTITAKKRRSA